ncbi:RluA family pseudouridine synthase [Planctomicrobium sp. SH527]|uniref:RluA family pseudouridine synthase n=1 Tax=Planctomicrobium sp. SH527 TaxID=3448123 RepID=UPI003F5B7481
MELTERDIICEDGPVIAVNKLHGVIAQGAPHGVDSLVDQVKRYLSRKYNKPGKVYLGIPHRIDRPVSGVVVFSRNSKCAARLSEQFANRQVEKFYCAVLERPPEPREGELVDWIYRIPDQSRVEISSESNRDAKLSNLTYRTLATHKGKALVEIKLGTGRMHQIRIQFGSRGCPIVGDEQYGSRTQFPGFGHASRTDAPIALHARQLTILHPIRYEPLPILAPIPELWKCFGFDLKSIPAPGESL